MLQDLSPKPKQCNFCIITVYVYCNLPIYLCISQRACWMLLNLRTVCFLQHCVSVFQNRRIILQDWCPMHAEGLWIRTSSVDHSCVDCIEWPDTCAMQIAHYQNVPYAYSICLIVFVVGLPFCSCPGLHTGKRQFLRYITRGSTSKPYKELSYLKIRCRCLMLLAHDCVLFTPFTPLW